MAATSALVVSTAADTHAVPAPTSTAARHQAPGTAARTRGRGRHRATGRGRLSAPLVVARPRLGLAPSTRLTGPAGLTGPTSGGRPAPLRRPSHAPTVQPVLTLAGDGRHRALPRALARPAAETAGRIRPRAVRPAVRVAAVLLLSAVLLPLSAGRAGAAPTSPTGTAGTAAANGALVDLPAAPGPEPRPVPAQPADLRWPTVGIAMALLVGITITGSAGVLLLRPVRREPIGAR
jgi:hypothetical protein